MIRINLVAGERAEIRSPKRGLQIGQKVTLAGTLILIVTVLLGGLRHRALAQRETELAADVNAARRDERRLADVLKQVTEFEARRTQLQQRATVIDGLRRGQVAPVHIIDQISRSLPALTWLTSIKQDGDLVMIDGACTSLTSLSDFVSNLEATRHFQRPVEIVTSEVVSGQSAVPDLIRFTIKGHFQLVDNLD